MMKIETIVICLLVCLAVVNKAAESDWDITSVAQIVRNGPSTPENHFYDELEFYTEIGGDSLTRNGERMMFNLGKWTKQQYDHVFHIEDEEHEHEEEEHDHDIHPHYFISKIFSSPSKKSMQSAQAYLLGMHEPGEGGQPTSTNPKILNPPFESLQATFANQSSLPFAFTQMNIRASVQDYKPFFEEDLRKACPILFDLHEEIKDTYEVKYPIAFKDLRDKLTASGIVIKGYKEHEGWSDWNIRRYFEAAESYKANTGNYMPNLTEELYNEIRVYYSYSTELNFFEDNMDYAAMWSSNIMLEISNIFDTMLNTLFPIKLWDKRGVTMFSTNGKQLYAFLQKLGLASKTCLLGVHNKSRPLMTSAEKVNDPEYCQLFPEFGSSLTFQFATLINKTEPYLRVLYNNQPLDILCKDKGTDHFCPYYAIKQYLYLSFVGFDHHGSCELEKKPVQEIIKIEKVKREYTNHFNLFWGSVVTCCLLFCIYIFVYCKNKNSEEGLIDQNVLKMKESLESNRLKMYRQSSNPNQNQNQQDEFSQNTVDNKIESGLSPEKIPQGGDHLSFDDESEDKEKEGFEFDEI